MNKVYWGWYEYIEDDTSDKTIGVKVEVKIKIEGWGTQRYEGLFHLIRELELDK